MDLFFLVFSMVEEGLFSVWLRRRTGVFLLLLLLRVRWGLWMDRVLRQDMWGMGMRVFEEWVYWRVAKVASWGVEREGGRVGVEGKGDGGWEM